MDDDEFGGFEAAEAFDSGNGEAQAVSPAIPWAAFPSGVHIPKTGTTDGLPALSESSTCLLSSDIFASSGDNTLTVSQDDDVTVIHAALPEQQSSSIPLGTRPLSSLNAMEKSSLEKSSLEKHSLEKSSLETFSDVVGDAVPLGSQGSTASLQQIISSLDVKLQDVEQEKARIKKELQDLMEQQSISAMAFLKEKESGDIAHGARYTKLQEQHKNELEDLRKAGHEALAIIVEEFKALLKSSVQQQGEANERQYQAAIEKQSQKCEELLKAQHQRLLDMLEKEEERFEQKMKEAFAQQLQDHKGALETCLAQERQRSKDALEAAVKIEQDAMKDVILKAVDDERKRLEIAHSKEKEAWQDERKNDQDTIAQAIEEALCVERKKCQDLVKTALEGEQKKSEMAVQEAVRQTRDEMMEYIKEQKRLDQVARQRSLSSLELFLACAQKQLVSLIEERPVGEEEKKN